MAVADTIKKAVLFEAFTPDELDAVVRLVKVSEHPDGDYVFLENARALALYVIGFGTVKIVKEDANGKQVTVAELTEGMHFGEMPLISKGPRAAAAITKGDVVLYEITYADIETMIKKSPESGMKLFRAMAQALCGRIRRTTQNYASLFLS
jgi:CRP/FNR family transcriptional regulator